MEHFEDNETNTQLQASDEITDFSTTAVLKRDVFSETHLGFFINDPQTRVIRRIVTASPWWARPLAWFLARRETRSLKKIHGLKGVPQLITTDRHGLYRSWAEGTPLHLTRPNQPGFYRNAHKILRNMRRFGITHNDLAKPQNWLMTPEGGAAIIDFQLSSVHKRRGALYRYLAYEDFRHLIKQKQSFANDLMTPTEWRIVHQRSWPSSLWLLTGKKIYNFFTRSIFNWSDGEGTGDRLQIQEPLIKKQLEKNSDVRDVALSLYSLPAKGVGVYAFVETDKLDEKTIRTLLEGQKIELVQPVSVLPRRKDGTVRDDVLQLIAMNQITELDCLLTHEPELDAIVKNITANRLNLTDRRITEFENRL